MTPHLGAENKEELKNFLMKVKEESEKVGLNSAFKNWKSWHLSHHFMANRWGNSGNSVRLYFWGLQNHRKGWVCNHGIKRHLLLGSKVMTNLDSILKSRDITLPTNVHLVKAMVFPAVMYGSESWTVKKAEHWRIDASNCGVGEDSWEPLGLQGDQTSQS